MENWGVEVERRSEGPVFSWDGMGWGAVRGEKEVGKEDSGSQ